MRVKDLTDRVFRHRRPGVRMSPLVGHPTPDDKTDAHDTDGDISEGDLSDEVLQDTVQPGGSRGECCSSLVTDRLCSRPSATERNWKDSTVGGAAIVLDIAKGGAEAFGPLKAVLEVLSTIYNQYKVRLLSFIRNFLLKSSSPGNCRCQGQDQSPTFACCRFGQGFRENNC